MNENIKIPILVRPLVAVGFVLFFSVMLLFTVIGGVFAIIAGAVVFLFTGTIKVTYAK